LSNKTEKTTPGFSAWRLLLIDDPVRSKEGCQLKISQIKKKTISNNFTFFVIVYIIDVFQVKLDKSKKRKLDLLPFKK